MLSLQAILLTSSLLLVLGMVLSLMWLASFGARAERAAGEVDVDEAL
jgi:hypothetical protein